MTHAFVGAAITIVVALGGAHLAGAIAFAQTPRPSFEIASVKPGNPDDALAFRLQPGGRFLVQGASLQVLIADAWTVQEYQIAGLPAWAKSGKYSVEAKTSGPIPPWPDSNKLLAAMLQTLLEERFALSVHLETRQDTIYNLVPAKNGFKLETAKPDAPNGFEMTPGQIHSLAVPLEYLAAALANVLRHPVYNQT